MGLDIDIYKTNRKDKKQFICHFGTGYWFIVTYLESLPDTKVDDFCEVKITREQVKTFIEKCRDVLLCYYKNTFDLNNGWVDAAKEILPIYKKDINLTYEKGYIEPVSIAYEEFLELYKKLEEDDIICIYISY